MDRSVQSVMRALRIVEALNDDQVVSLEALHRKTRLPKPTLVRLLETLVEAGYAVRVSRRDGYSVTEGVLRLSAGVRARDIVVDVGRPLIEAFTREHRWQVSLATHEGDAMVIRATTRHISPFSREQVFLNRRVAVLTSAVGRAYFAYASPEEQEVILRLTPFEGDPGCAETRAQLIAERVRACGYAKIRRPHDDPYRSFAIPVLGPDAPAEPMGSLVMFWYRSVMPEREATERYLAPLCEVARAIASGVAAASSAPGAGPARLDA